jgi:hypothetical protein
VRPFPRWRRGGATRSLLPIVQHHREFRVPGAADERRVFQDRFPALLGG